MYAPDNSELHEVLSASKPATKQSFAASDAVTAGLVATVSIGLGLLAVAYGVAIGTYQASQTVSRAVFGSRGA